MTRSAVRKDRALNRPTAIVRMSVGGTSGQRELHRLLETVRPAIGGDVTAQLEAVQLHAARKPSGRRPARR